MKRRGVCRERILRVLLNEPEGTLSKYRVAKNAGCSFSWLHEFLGKLEVLGLVSGTKVKDYAELLKYWQRVKIRPIKKEYMHKDFLSLLKKQRLQYALTTYQGENLVQHYLFPSRIDVYIREEDAERWHELITREGLVGKGNVRLLITDEHIFYETLERSDLNVVSPPQLIVDLFEEGGVCVEAAEKLLERVAVESV
ncbi:MAG: hypothetical protein ACE5R6_18500 [Candidatus Heimdallarchaeota archaeon]